MSDNIQGAKPVYLWQLSNFKLQREFQASKLQLPNSVIISIIFRLKKTPLLCNKLPPFKSKNNIFHFIKNAQMEAFLH